MPNYESTEMFSINPFEKFQSTVVIKHPQFGTVKKKGEKCPIKVDAEQSAAKNLVLEIQKSNIAGQVTVSIPPEVRESFTSVPKQSESLIIMPQKESQNTESFFVIKTNDLAFQKIFISPKGYYKAGDIVDGPEIIHHNNTTIKLTLTEKERFLVIHHICADKHMFKTHKHLYGRAMTVREADYGRPIKDSIFFITPDNHIATQVKSLCTFEKLQMLVFRT